MQHLQSSHPPACQPSVESSSLATAHQVCTYPPESCFDITYPALAIFQQSAMPSPFSSLPMHTQARACACCIGLYGADSLSRANELNGGSTLSEGRCAVYDSSPLFFTKTHSASNMYSGDPLAPAVRSSSYSGSWAVMLAHAVPRCHPSHSSVFSSIYMDVTHVPMWPTIPQSFRSINTRRI